MGKAGSLVAAGFNTGFGDGRPLTLAVPEVASAPRIRRRRVLDNAITMRHLPGYWALSARKDLSLPVEGQGRNRGADIGARQRCLGIKKSRKSTLISRKSTANS